MRRLVTKEEAEKSRKRNQVIIGFVLAFVMILSTIGFALQNSFVNNAHQASNEEKVTYNGFDFAYSNGLWVLGSLVFTYNPNQVQSINAEKLKDIDNYRGKPMYISSENENAENEIYLNFINFASRIQKACLQGQNCTGDLVVKTCADNFIIIKEGNDSIIKQEGNCVYIEGQKEELVKNSDEFLFRVFGIR